MVIFFQFQVSYMEGRISDGKKKKVEFIEKAREHEQVIQGLRSALGDSLSYLEKQGSSLSSTQEPSALSKSLPANSSSSASSTSSLADKYSTSCSFHTPSSSKRPYSVGPSAAHGRHGSSYSAATKGHSRSHI